eukprot:3464225-Rhodomonas_salina.1
MAYKDSTGKQYERSTVRGRSVPEHSREHVLGTLVGELRAVQEASAHLVPPYRPQYHTCHSSIPALRTTPSVASYPLSVPHLP